MEELLKDPNTNLTDEFLVEILDGSYAAWSELNGRLSGYDIVLEWRHYRDGGWLTKATHKKKTVFWGSVSEGFFTVSFIFSEKPHLRAGIQELSISDNVKKSIVNSPKGKFFSITINVYNEDQLSDICELIGYKKNAK